MDKILLILKREYTSRVFKKSFLLVTLLTPIGMGAIMFIAGYLGANSTKSEKKVLVSDSSGMIYKDSIKNDELVFSFSNKPIDELKKTYIDQGYDILVHISKTDSQSVEMNAGYYSKEKLSFIQLERLENRFEKVIKIFKLNNSGLDKAVLNRLDVDLKLENAMLDEKDSDVKGDKSSKFASSIATGLSYLMGFLMYMVIFIFGSMVMRSVMEEKINRVVEVMISSIKPFQLMLGKVLGVGLVGLTQLLIWLILFPIVSIVISKFIGGDAAAAGQSAEAIKQLNNDNFVLQFLSELGSLNWLFIIPVFIFFFFGGYFIYSTLFAAIGSASSDDMQDSQQLMMPIIIVVIFAFAMISPVVTNPNSGLAIFGSLFPLTSPILMPARLPFDPPMWQVILSMVLLLGSIIGLTWVAARIYRVGILMYGKKATFGELWKWMKMSE
jgi:ABC-2 type transport system permease protein